MSNDDRPQGPGLKWRKRRHGEPVPYWFASDKAVRAGYPVKSANLSGFVGREIAMRCERLQTEMNMWLNNAPRIKPQYDGTFGSLITIYETDPESKFHKLKPRVRTSYLVYIRRLKSQLGEVRVDDSDGTDAQRWFRGWRVAGDGKDRLPRALFALAVLKAAITFGVVRRLKGLADFQQALSAVEFPSHKRRKEAPTAEQIIAARQAAHACGHPERALVYALQFETTGRQWDFIGAWLPLSEPQPSLVLRPGQKWIGPMWSAIDANQILKFKPSKTEDTTEVEVCFDLAACPMVQEDLACIPTDKRNGPLVVDPATGVPYTYQDFHAGWRADFKAAGLPPAIWGRDLRAGGITEGGKSAASKDDRRKLAGHAHENTTEGYDRDMIEAHRRVMASRTKYREKNGP